MMEDVLLGVYFLSLLIRAGVMNSRSALVSRDDVPRECVQSWYRVTC